MITGILGFAFLLSSAVVVVLGLYCLICMREIRNPKRQSTGWALARSRASEPDQIDPGFTQWQLDRPDGTTLPVWEARTDHHHQGRCEATLVFLHGWGNGRTHSIERAKALLEARGSEPAPPRWRLIFFDQRGHGDASEGPTTLGIQELEDLGALLKQLPEDAPRLLVGHSLGAVLAIRAATRWPGLVDAVLALAPYRSVRTPIDRTLRMRGLPAGWLGTVIGRLGTSAEFMRLDTVEDAREMTQPLLVLSGAEDLICPPQDGARIADAARNGRFEQVDSVRHGDLHRQVPEALARAVSELLEQISATKQDATEQDATKQGAPEPPERLA